jgi:hypothetical protein
MQKVSIAFLFFVTTLGFVACQRDSSAVGNPVSLEATKTSSIQKGEPVLFTLEKASGTVQWKIKPSNNVLVNASANSASILFGNSGTYQVNASAGADSAIKIVHVTDSVYHGADTTIPNSTTIPISSDDQVHLTLARAGTADSIGLSISAVTTKTYDCLNHWMQSKLSISGMNYQVSFDGIIIPNATNCTTGQATGSSMNFISRISDGSHSFNVILNGTTYTGSFVKSGTTYTFTWPYSSGVTLTPLVIN